MQITLRRIVFLTLTAAVGCNSRNPELAEDPKSAVALTGGLNTSMIYVARTDSGVIAIDLGWWGHEKPMSHALARIDASPQDVKRVFITHSHRDHIAAWPRVLTARFHMSEAERLRFTGEAEHDGWMVRWAEWLNASHLPDSARLQVHAFGRDTAFILGSDTLRAYVTPGHTAGSAVYLFRGGLFLGDAVTYKPFLGFRPAKAQFTDDSRQARESLKALWPRLPENQVRIICTAHGECARFTPELIKHLMSP